MSKALEALKRIINEISNYKLHGIGDGNWLGIQDILKDVELVEQALKRNEPMKVDSPKQYVGLGYSKCPKCGIPIIQDCYCSNCGQKLDWSDEK